MAKVKIFAALGAYGEIGDFVASGALFIDASTPTTLTATDFQGDGFTFTGTGLTYGPFGVTGGTFTGLRVFSSNDATLQTVTNFSESALDLFVTFQVSGLAAAVFQLFQNDDLVIGSNLGDNLFGFSGNDTIKGGGGADIIGGSVGRDKLFGEGGADTFIYVNGDGRDTIMDFTDTGGRNDDRIGLTQRQYDSMTAEETLTGVTLSIGARGVIVVNGWTLAEVGLNDFLIG